MYDLNMALETPNWISSWIDLALHLLRYFYIKDIEQVYPYTTNSEPR